MISLIARVLLAVSLAALVSSADAQRRPSAAPLETARISLPLQRAAAVTPAAPAAVLRAPLKSLLVDLPFADVGFPDGFRLSNLGGRREVYIPVPQGIELNPAEPVHLITVRGVGYRFKP